MEKDSGIVSLLRFIMCSPLGSSMDIEGSYLTKHTWKWEELCYMTLMLIIKFYCDQQLRDVLGFGSVR